MRQGRDEDRLRCVGRKHENMMVAGENALLARFNKTAGSDEMLNIHDLKTAYEKAIGHAAYGTLRGFN